MNKGLPQGISSLRAFSARAKPGALHMGLGKPHEDMPPELRKLAAELMQNKELRMDYSENAGFLPVRRLLEAHYELPENSSILTHGAEEGLFAAFLALLNPGDEVLVPNPGFLAYAPMVRSLRGKAKEYRLKKMPGGFEYDLAAIRKGINKNTKVIVLNAPANPTGSLIHVDFVRELAEEFPKITVLSDEVYAELDFQTPYVPFARYAPNVISVNAFSKSHALTGWRIGWAACSDPKLTNRLLVAHQYIATCASAPAQHLLGALLAKPKLFSAIRDRYCFEYLERRDALLKALGPATEGVDAPRAGFYHFLPIPKDFGSSLEFGEALLEKNLVVTPGEFFGSAGKGHVRLSFATSLDNCRAAGKILHSFY